MRDASVPAQFEAWAAANGYGPASESQSIGVGSLWVTPDGIGYLSLLQLDELELERERRVTGVDLQPTDVQVLHRTVVEADWPERQASPTRVAKTTRLFGYSPGRPSTPSHVMSRSSAAGTG
ncbi:hypothetical protein [Agrococcus sp. TSP3-2-1]|uniref:hypothetical protein n=1 Tax=Agrococcus sp. TSP3-2-1 TaxID=2804583 RepID=UPI003CFB1663